MNEIGETEVECQNREDNTVSGWYILSFLLSILWFLAGAGLLSIGLLAMISGKYGGSSNFSGGVILFSVLSIFMALVIIKRKPFARIAGIIFALILAVLMGIDLLEQFESINVSQKDPLSLLSTYPIWVFIHSVLMMIALYKSDKEFPTDHKSEISGPDEKAEPHK